MSDISTYYGGSCLALKGKDSVLILSDLRLGKGALTVSKKCSKAYEISKNLYVGLTLFNPDCVKVSSILKEKVRLLELEKSEDVTANELTWILSSELYKKRFMPYYTNPIVAGFDDKGCPYVSNMDLIGCVDERQPFVACGTSSDTLIGVSEAFYEENLDDEQLFTVGSQIFLNSVDRDALSGWGVEGILICKDKIIRRVIKNRMD